MSPILNKSLILILVTANILMIGDDKPRSALSEINGYPNAFRKGKLPKDPKNPIQPAFADKQAKIGPRVVKRANKTQGASSRTLSPEFPLKRAKAHTTKVKPGTEAYSSQRITKNQKALFFLINDPNEEKDHFLIITLGEDNPHKAPALKSENNNVKVVAAQSHLDCVVASIEHKKITSLFSNFYFLLNDLPAPENLDSEAIDEIASDLATNTINLKRFKLEMRTFDFSKKNYPRFFSEDDPLNPEIVLLKEIKRNGKPILRIYLEIERELTFPENEIEQTKAGGRLKMGISAEIEDPKTGDWISTKSFLSGNVAREAFKKFGVDDHIAELACENEFLKKEDEFEG